MWDATTFSKNRDRLLAGEVAQQFLAAVLAQPRVKRLLSSEHFTVDGTLMEAWASLKSFRPKDGSGDPPEAGAQRRATFTARGAATTRMPRPPIRCQAVPQGAGQGARLCFMGHAADGEPQRPGGRRGGDARLGPRRADRARWPDRAAADGRTVTLGADKGYDSGDLSRRCARSGGHPACRAEPERRRSAIDGRTTRHPGYAAQQRIRKRIEEAFGWAKTVAGLRKTASPRTAQGRLAIHPRHGRLRSRPPAQTARPNRAMTTILHPGRATLPFGDNNLSRSTRF